MGREPMFLSKADPLILKEAIKNCFEFRKTQIPRSFTNNLNGLDTTLLERGWSSVVASLPQGTSFKEAWKTVVAIIKQIEERW